MTQVTPTNDNGKLMHEVIVKGNLAQLTEAERTMYYVEVCKSVGLNPLTKPFEYITLNGKLVLYAKRDATDQLRQVHGVSVDDMSESERDNVFIVTAKVKNAAGRTDIAKGAVNIKGLTGDALANALMKAETKAKRRATLSICGLGMLDESEVETIPNAQPMNLAMHEVDTAKPVTPFKTATLRNQYCKNVKESFNNSKNSAELAEVASLNKAMFDRMEASGDERDSMALDDLRNTYKQVTVRFNPPKDDDYDDEPTFSPEEIAEIEDRAERRSWI